MKFPPPSLLLLRPRFTFANSLEDPPPLLLPPLGFLLLLLPWLRDEERKVRMEPGTDRRRCQGFTKILDMFALRNVRKRINTFPVPKSIFPPANPLPGRGLVSPPLPFNEKSSSFLLLLRSLVENLEAERKEEEPTRGGWNFCPTPTVPLLLLLHFKSTWERGRECVRIYNNTNKGPLDLFFVPSSMGLQWVGRVG